MLNMPKRITLRSAVYSGLLGALLATGPSVPSVIAAEPGHGTHARAAQATQAGQSEKAVRTLTFEEALAIADEHNLALHQARLDLEDARLALVQTEATHLMRPNPVQLLQAESGLRVAEKALAKAREEMVLSVADDYFGVLRLDHLIKVTQEGLALAERQLEVAKEKYAAGAVAELDVIRATSQVSDMRANLLKLQGNRHLLAVKFAQTLGLSSDEAVQPAAEAFQFRPAAVDLERDLAWALKHRVEILQMQAGVAAARKQVELSTNTYTPEVAKKRAEVALHKAELGLQQVMNGIRLEVIQQYEALLDAERRLHVLEQGIREAAETLRITEAMYRADMATDIEVLGAQSALTKARTDHITALYDHLIAKVRYDKAVAKHVPEGEE